MDGDVLNRVSNLCGSAGGRENFESLTVNHCSDAILQCSDA